MLEIQLHLDSHLVATSGRSVILLTAHNHASQSLGYFDADIGYLALSSDALLDVVSNALVELSEGEPPPHLALSYVWGSVPNFRLTTVNRSRLMSPRGIENAWNLLSATIKDAISLTRMLEVRYIWIDSLCLVQNDDLDLEQGVRVDGLHIRAV